MTTALHLDDLAETIEPMFERVVDRATTGVVLRTLHAEAMLYRDLGPLCLDGHEIVILSAVECAPDAHWPAFVGLEPRHFGCPVRGAAFGVMRARRAAGLSLERDDLREALREVHPLTVGIDNLLDAILRAPPLGTVDLRRLVEEVMAAAAWSDFMADLRTVDRHLRVDARAALERQRRPLLQVDRYGAVGFDAQAALGRLDELRAALAGAVGVAGG